VASGKLLAGEYPRNKDKESSILKISAFAEARISVFIDLTEEDEGLLSYSDLLESASYHRFPIRDISIPDSAAEMISILDTM
jgi:hypothetical protein